MPPDSGGILRGCPLLGGAVCPDVVSRAVWWELSDLSQSNPE